MFCMFYGDRFSFWFTSEKLFLFKWNLEIGIILKFLDDSDVESNANPYFNTRSPFDFGTNHKTKHVVFELHFDFNPKYIRWFTVKVYILAISTARAFHDLSYIKSPSIGEALRQTYFSFTNIWSIIRYGLYHKNSWFFNSKICLVEISRVQWCMTYDHLKGNYDDYEQ